MSKEALAKVVQRAISDAGFRRQLSSDPAGALRGFDLSAEETSALRTGDAGRLSTLGVDQRMSKAFSLGGALAATRMSQSDLTGGNATAIDDASGAGSRTVIPHDPAAVGSADATGSEAIRSKLPSDADRMTTADATGGTGGTNTVRAGDDYKFAARQAPEAAGSNTVRAGDDYKFTDRVASQSNAAPVEGSPEADAAQQAEGSGMAAYPAHNGLAGPSGAQSARAGDDWKFADRTAAQANAAPVEGSPEADAASQAAASGGARIGTARLDDASGSSSGARAINDDPDGFLAANAKADLSGSVTRANVVNDDPDGFLAANANADLSGGVTRGDGTAFVDESEAYLTKVGYDASAADSAVTDAHDRSWSGDQNADPASVADDDSSSASSEHGPTISS
jgi:hypothetical protein